MRKPIVAGNWKMNKTASEAISLIEELVPLLAEVAGVEKVVCPPYITLHPIAGKLAGSEVGLGAQNLYFEQKGAYTGEVSPNMVAEVCQYVIIGHSERRAYFGETDEGVNKKVKAAVSAGITPIICVGETLEENQSGRTDEVVSGMVKAALEGIESATVEKLIIAYEPVWAIGTGLPATAKGANDVISKYVRGTIANLYGKEIAEEVRIQYGGSVTPGNAAEYFSQPDIDGALVGGASLKAQDFFGIVKAAVKETNFL